MEFGPYAWLAIAAIAAVAEVLSLSLITVWFVAGALVAFLVGLAGASTLAQLVVFLAVSVVCLALFRPLALKYRKKGAAEEPTLVGQVVVVCEDIDNDRMAGRVETPDHMTWAAKSIDGLPIAKGERAVVVSQESIKLIVERKPA